MPIQTAIDSISNSAGSPYGFKNRIINGAMVIDQRNAGASVTANDNIWAVDRWQYSQSQSSKGTSQQNAGSVTPPPGFKNYIGFTSSSAYSVTSSDSFILRHHIEGNNIADLDWGSSTAKPVTFSFWVRSSLTGTFSGFLTNSAINRVYVFTYTISSANTWEYKTITILGDTTGTWLTDTGRGIMIGFALGQGSTYLTSSPNQWGSSAVFGSTGTTSVVGTNGATFYVTGCQLEVGRQATSFDFRSLGTELQLCQRYFQKTFPQGVAVAQNAGYNASCLVWNSSGSNNAYGTQVQWRFPVTMRAAPSVTYYNPVAANGNARNFAITADMSLAASPVAGPSQLSTQFVAGDTSSTAGQCCVIHVAADAEL